MDSGADAIGKGRRIRSGRRVRPRRRRLPDQVVLVARLRALMRRGAPVRPTVLTAGTLCLDPARRRVTRGDQLLALTPREFGVLEFLMRHAGDVVTNAEILTSVWDVNYEGRENVVEVYVGYLRKKI